MKNVSIDKRRKGILIDDVITELAKSLDKSFYEVESIVRSQFRFLKDTMEEGKYEDVIVKYIGKFRVHPKRKEYWNNKLKDGYTAEAKLDQRDKRWMGE